MESYWAFILFPAVVSAFSFALFQVLRASPPSVSFSLSFCFWLTDKVTLGIEEFFAVVESALSNSVWARSKRRIFDVLAKLLNQFLFRSFAIVTFSCFAAALSAS